MKPICLVFLLLFIFIKTYSQTEGSLADTNFLTNPTWTGDTDYFIFHDHEYIQSNGPKESTEIYLSTESQVLENTEWQFHTSFAFNPSSSNYIKIYLASDSPNLTEPLNGYYIKLGGIPGDQDAIELYRQEGDISHKIIEGIPGNVGNSQNDVRIKVVRDSRGHWYIYSDITGGSDFIFEGSGRDDTFTYAKWFGLSFTHTTTRRSLFHFRDFSIRTAPFLLTEVKQEDNKTLKLSFTSQPDSQTISKEKFYLQSIGNPQEVMTNVGSALEIRLQYDQAFPPGQYLLKVKNIKDTDGRELVPPFRFPINLLHHYSYGDILITEIHPNPNPPVALPNEEFVELFNNTSDEINLENFTYADRSVTAILPSYNLEAGERVILCRAAAQQAYEAFGKTLALERWPRLNITGDKLWLRDPAGNLIFNLHYHPSWYKDREKSDGGWSLEMKNTAYHCIGKENWAASTDPTGGTPGNINSLEKQNLPIPQLHVNDLKILDTANINIGLNIKPDTSEINSSNFSILYRNHKVIPTYKEEEITVQISPPLELNLPYQFSIANLSDCAGKPAKDTLINLIIPDIADSLDIIINEVLFNPPNGGREFVEIYNKSNKFIDLQHWEIANIRNGEIAVRRTISDRPLLFAPYSYLVLTTDLDLLLEFYPNTIAENVVLLNTLPSIPNSSGAIAIIDNTGKMCDRFDYSESYHFPLLHNKRGVSLERISFFAPTNTPDNWFSASESVGFATPGFKNSQKSTNKTEKLFSVEPKSFSPNGDGYNDFTTINYALDFSGAMANITIYDSHGRKVKELVKNAILGKEGFFQWDGTNEQKAKVNTGYYLVYIEVSNMSGQVISYKETVAVGTRFGRN
ncbi:lamin tail domain-containing protein [Cytophagaceae bacterium ABcell3]|nr:lamin tail domain-containing protein [Cytophagaceae bacterium ABcell3]